VSVEELVSEVWAKLLGSFAIQDEKPMPPFAEATFDLDAPDRDGRIIWLVEEVGGIDVMSHRVEDILRQRHGRHRPDVGRPLVQTDGEEDTLADCAAEPSIDGASDIPLIWIGLLKLAKTRFPPGDDVAMLLKLFTNSPNLFDDAPGAQWPISEIVTSLNMLFPDPAWRADRVDNAKRRLVSWIKRLKQRNGLDDTDLEALFVRVARGLNSEKRALHRDISDRPILS
jgi:hypothetical protein